MFEVLGGADPALHAPVQPPVLDLLVAAPRDVVVVI